MKIIFLIFITVLFYGIGYSQKIITHPGDDTVKILMSDFIKKPVFSRGKNYLNSCFKKYFNSIDFPVKPNVEQVLNLSFWIRENGKIYNEKLEAITGNYSKQINRIKKYIFENLNHWYPAINIKTGKAVPYFVHASIFLTSNRYKIFFQNLDSENILVVRDKRYYLLIMAGN